MDRDIYNEDTNDEDIDDEETNEEFYEATYTYVMAIYALIDILNQFLNMMRGEHIERPLTRRQITSRGYDYIHKALNDDPAIFRQVYRMYPDVFRKLCTIIREKTPLEDTRFICVEEMLASFLQIVGQNTRYCSIADLPRASGKRGLEVRLCARRASVRQRHKPASTRELHSRRLCDDDIPHT
ncbi:hypothetical protein JHK87_010718 [Glycine soja]|nr:hypothetical protein JHK87_010718 [Glycine soja]